MKNNTIHIKNMVCNRCIMVVTEALKRMGFTPLSVELGTAILQEPMDMTYIIQTSSKGFSLCSFKRLNWLGEMPVILRNCVLKCAALE